MRNRERGEGERDKKETKRDRERQEINKIKAGCMNEKQMEAAVI